MKDVIICLGDVFYTNKTIQNMRLRTERSVQLYKEGKAARIIFTGGFKTRKDISEAQFMSDNAKKSGVPKKDILLEENANSTVGNAYYCKKILDKKQFHSAIIVTSPHHLRRAKYIFKKFLPEAHLEFIASESNLNFRESIRIRINEFFILLKLKMKGIHSSKV